LLHEIGHAHNRESYSETENTLSSKWISYTQENQGISFLENLEDEEIGACIKALSIPMGIELFEQFDDRRKEDIFDCFSAEWMAGILEEMSPDERADLVKFLPDEKLERVLPLIARAERIDIKKLIQYKEGTAGSILTTEYASLSPDITIKEAYDWITALTRPYPGAFYSSVEGKIFLWAASPNQYNKIPKRPVGSFLFENRQIVIGCKDGNLLITDYEVSEI